MMGRNIARLRIERALAGWSMLVRCAVLAMVVGCGSTPPPSAVPTPGQTAAPSGTPVSTAPTTSQPSGTPDSHQVGPLAVEECDQLGYIPCEHLATALRIPIAGTGAALTYSSEWAPGRLDRPSGWDVSDLGLGGWSLDILQRYDASNGILLGGDGTWRFAEALPLPGGETAVPSLDGRLVYVFNAAGRHVRTAHGILGVDLLLFSYDAAGRFLTAKGSLYNDPVDFTVERAADGALSGIVGAGGIETRVDGDGLGHIGAINHPDGGRDGFFSDEQGRINTRFDPAGGVARFEYDDQGRIAATTDPDGVRFTYERSVSDNEAQTKIVPALGEPATFRRRTVDGGIELSYTAPDGPTTTVVRSSDGQRTVTLADGTTLTIGAVADPRWGVATPILSPAVEERPDGVVRRTEIQITAETEPGDPLAVNAWSRTTSIDGDTYVERLDSARRAIVSVDPLGLETTSSYDDHGLLIAYSAPGQPPAAFSYDDQGRLASETHGSGADAAVTTYTYGPNGRVDVGRPDGVTDSLLYDAVGRIVEQTAGDGSSLLSTYDAVGRAILVRPGGQQSTTLGYSPAGRLTAYVPPVVADDTSYELRSYDAVGRLVALSGPGPRQLSVAYDDGGRLISVAFDRGQTETTYDPDTNKPATITGPGGVATTYGYVGDLRSAMVWTGPIAGDVRLAFDARGRPVSEIVNSGAPAQFAYDGAGRLSTVGSVVIERAADSGLPVTMTLGAARLTREYDANGFLARASATVGGNLLIALDYERDVFGRVTRLTESSPAGERVVEYAYDGAGRLERVTVEGATAEQSAFDTRGNRVSMTAPGTSITAEYDARNQLRRWANATFEYQPDGTLARRLEGGAQTTFDFDDLGALRGVGLANGRQVEYVVDGSGRRIGRRVDGQLTAGYLYRPDGPLVAELDATGTVVARFTRDDKGRLISMERDGRSFLMVTDELGSPRLIADAATGEIVQVIEYDAWGRVVSDSNPGFQPFGFAGGLLDPDTGLVHFGAREYDPTVGRWIEPDPMRFDSSDANLYAYAGNDPVNRSDPTGLGAPGLGHLCTAEDPCTGETWSPRPDGGWNACKPAGGGRECYPWYGPDPVPGEPPPSGGTWPPVWPPPDPSSTTPTPPPGPAGPTPGKKGGGVPCIGICFPPGGGICVGFCSMGDPHIRTADRLPIDFQGASEYLMVASADGNVVIQARQEPPGDLTSITITTALAASVAGDRVAVYLDEEVTMLVNGQAVAATDGTIALPNGGSVTRQGISFVIEWPDGSRLMIERRGNHLDYGFQPDPAVGPTLTGLMGTPNGDVSDDLVSRDRSLTLSLEAPDFFGQLHGPFGNSWRISQEESLFDYGPGQSTATFTRPEIPSALATTDAVDPAARVAAEQLCRAAGVTSEPTLSDCILDVGMTGDPSYAASAAAVEASIDAAPPAAAPVAITIGSAIAGMLHNSDETDRYLFTAKAGDAIYLDALGPCTTQISWRVVPPSGTITAQEFVCHDLGRVELTETGTYTVQIFAPTGSSDTGPYGFIVRRAGGGVSTPIALGQPVSGAVAQIGDEPTYTFEASAGQVVYLDARGPCVDGLSWTLFDPLGARLGGEPVCTDIARRELTDPGTYRLVVSSAEAVTGSFEFTVYAVPPPRESAIAIGATVSDVIAAVGETHRYAFDATAGQVIVLHATGACVDQLEWRLLSPSGIHLGSAPSCFDVGLPTLPESGRYTIEVYSPTTATGSYAFELRPGQ